MHKCMAGISFSTIKRANEAMGIVRRFNERVSCRHHRYDYLY